MSEQDDISDIRARLNGAPLVFGILMDSNDYLDLADSDGKRLLAEVDRLSAENKRLREWLQGIATIPSDLQLAQAMADDALRGERLSEILADGNKKDTL